MSSAVRDQRLDMRLPAAQKSLIERAAAITGVPVSAFALEAMVERATEVIATHETTTLRERDWDAFVRILDEDQPNDALIAAAKRFRRG